jgi:hypothetical protein
VVCSKEVGGRDFTGSVNRQAELPVDAFAKSTHNDTVSESAHCSTRLEHNECTMSGLENYNRVGQQLSKYMCMHGNKIGVLPLLSSEPEHIME